MELAQNAVMVRLQQVHLHVIHAHLAVLYVNMIHYHKLILANPVFLNMDFSIRPAINVQATNTQWEELNHVMNAILDVLNV